MTQGSIISSFAKCHENRGNAYTCVLADLARIAWNPLAYGWGRFSEKM